MKNFNKKGQAAMEFLMTYGWAILAAVIVIGALGSYFYFNQGGTNNIFVNAPFGGRTVIFTAGQISLEIENKMGQDLLNAEINVTGNGCTAQTVNFTTGSNQQVIALACTGVTSGAVKGDIKISYYKEGDIQPSLATGTVSGSVAS